jgi:hypothetical protein
MEILRMKNLMLERQIFKGNWQLPTSESVGGILTYEPAGNVRLELFGSLIDEEAMVCSYNEADYICGITNDGKNLSPHLTYHQRFPLN